MPISRGALVVVRAITPLTPVTGELMGFAENFTAGKVMNAEIFVPIGSFFGVESLYHGETGQWSWGEAHTMHDFEERGLVPRKVAEESFVAYALRVLRRTDGAKIAHLLGAVPNSADIAVTAMARLNSNISGVCQIVQLGSSFNAPGTQ